MDVIQTGLLVLLGASIANVIDTLFQFTPRLGDWIAQRIGR